MPPAPRADTVAAPPAPAADAPPEPVTTGRVPYQPGLDGLRAVALLSIFVVHANLGLAPGGFLAVSTFFTLSGFLITALLAGEHRARGHIDLPAFWGRRARRLLPAALLGVLGTSVATLWLGDAGQVARLRDDAVGALAYVANWRFLLAGDTYAGEFEGQSPLLHFWSLAIEEQFYVVFPVAMVVALGAARRWWRPAPVAALVAGIALSVAAGAIGSAGTGAVDRLYFRTDVRAAELLVGALAGLWWVRRGDRLTPGAHRAIRAAGAALLAVIVALVLTSDYHDRFWYRGGLLAYALATVAVVLAAVEPAGPVRRLLAWPPLVAVGVVSYGAYLVHWPLFLWLFSHTSLPGPGRLVVGTAGSLAVAGLSYHWVERPVRERRTFPRPALLAAGTALGVAALVVAAAAPRLATTDEIPLDAAAEALAESLAQGGAGAGGAPAVAFFGDSTALVTSLGMAMSGTLGTDVRIAPGWASLGCSIMSPVHLISGGREIRTPEACDDWFAGWTKVAAENDIDLGVLQFGPWEVKDMRPSGTDEFRVVGDPVLDRLIEDTVNRAVDALLEEMPVVALLTSPLTEPGRVNGRPPTTQLPEADPTRMASLNAILARVAARDPRIALIDLAGYLDASGEDRRLRPDGIHFSNETAQELSPVLARTFASVIDVAAGGAVPAPSPDRMPVLRYARRH